MKNSDYLLLFIISFLGGIFIADFFIDRLFLQIISIFFGGILIFFKFFNFHYLRGGIFISLGILLGMFRFFVSFEGAAMHVQNFTGYIELYGCIETEVDVRSDRVKYTIESKKVIKGDEEFLVFGKVLITANRYPVFEYGDCLLVKGSLDIPEKIEDFDYDKYLARYDVYAVMNRVKITLAEERIISYFYENIFKIKSVFENRLSEIYAEPHSSFMAGLILGSRKGIPLHLMSDFNTTGLTHIIAISGYNITLIIVIVSGMLSFLSRRKKVLVSILFVIVFVILVGASAAVVRAGIMGIISLLAIWFGRPYFVTLGLFLAAFIMNVWNPKILVYDVGFQLSFLATCGLLYVSPLIEKYFLFLTKKFEIRESIMMTISAQILALPVIVIDFERLSLISPIANLFVLPWLPLAMTAGFFAVVVSFFVNWMGVLIGFFGYLALELLIFFVNVFALVPYASVVINWFTWWMLVIYYYFVLSWILRQSQDDNKM